MSCPPHGERRRVLAYAHIANRSMYYDTIYISFPNSDIFLFSIYSILKKHEAHAHDSLSTRYGKMDIE